MKTTFELDTTIAGARATRSITKLMNDVLKPLVSRASTFKPAHPNGRRFIVIHLDGVSRETLFLAMREGYAPFLKSLAESKGYTLSPALSGAPASTPAFQAGLLYGARRADIPGYMWFDREKRREIRMDNKVDTAAVEGRLRRAHRSLFECGSVNYAIFTGNADVNAFTMAGWGEPETRVLHSHELRDLAAATVAHSITAGRIAGRFFSETSDALTDLFRWAKKVGRFQHEGDFFWHRVGLQIGAREHGTWGTLMDIARGSPAIYTCFMDYDEVAHRRGPTSVSALVQLQGLDDAVAAIYAAAASVPEFNYDLYVMSDHGQVQTHPFEQTTGMTLGDYLAFAVPQPEGAPRVPEEAARRMNRYHQWDRAACCLPKKLQGPARQVARDIAKALLASRTDTECLKLLDEVVCVEAGDIAHIYAGQGKEPLNYEALQAKYPRLVDVLVRCPSVGVVAVRGGAKGYAWLRGERFDLSSPDDCARLSLGYGGRQAAEFLAKMLSIKSAGDIVVYGNGLPNHGVAFAWEFGSHGGIGREEVETFVIHPRHAPHDFSQVKHAADMYDYFSDVYRVFERQKPAELHVVDEQDEASEAAH